MKVLTIFVGIVAILCTALVIFGFMLLAADFDHYDIKPMCEPPFDMWRIRVYDTMGSYESYLVRMTPEEIIEHCEVK